MLKLMANDGIEAALASLLWFTLAHRLILTGLALTMCLFPLLIHLSLLPLLSAFHFCFLRAVILCQGQLVVIREKQKGVSVSVNCKR